MVPRGNRDPASKSLSDEEFYITAPELGIEALSRLMLLCDETICPHLVDPDLRSLSDKMDFDCPLCATVTFTLQVSDIYEKLVILTYLLQNTYLTTSDSVFYALTIQSPTPFMSGMKRDGQKSWPIDA